MSSLPLVLHVLPMDLERGAQRYAHGLRQVLDGGRARHRVLTLFEAKGGALSADIELSVPDLGRRFGFEPRVIPGLLSAVRRENPAVLVAHGSEPLKYVAAIPARVPVIYYKIGISTDAARVGVRRRLHTFLMRRAAWVAGVSQECLSESRTWFGVSEEKLVLIPNGRDPEAFRPRSADTDAGASEPVVVWVGRFARGKRPEVFLDVVERMRREGLAFSARMIGNGPELSSLRSRAATLGVELLGARDDVPELLRAADVLIFTSLPAGEGMPGVFVEAGLSGLPVVTTDVPGARTVILETQTGYIEGIDDIQGLAARTAALVNDRTLRKKLGAAARARCAQDFTLEASARRWEELLERVF